MLGRTKYQNLMNPCVRIMRAALACSIALAGAAQSQTQEAPAQEPTGPARFRIQADGSVTPQAGTVSAPPAPGVSGAVPRLADGMPDVATPVMPAQTEAAPGVPATGSIAAPESTPAARAVAVARDAMRNKQWPQLAQLVPQARGDVLEMYPEYWDLRNQLWSSRSPELSASLEGFLKRRAGSYLADRLRGEWLLVAARSGDFILVRNLGEIQSTNNQIQCAQLEARHMLGQRATAAEALRVFGPGGTCWKLFDQLVADRVLGPDELIPYLQDAVENNKTTDARRFAAYVFDQANLAAYDAMMRDPAKWLAAQHGPRSESRDVLAALALSRVGRTDLNKADSLASVDWADKLPKPAMQWVRAQLALMASFNLDARAYGWYRAAGSVRLSDNNYAWRVRTALRQRQIDWAWVVQCIDQMPVALKADPAWVYWKARAVQAGGDPAQAKALYETISGQFNFYGQLALEELGQPIVTPARSAPVTATELAQARANPSLRRAVTLFKRGWRPDAVPEWNFALRGMTDRQLLAAAEVARDEHIYDRVVNTSDRTLREFDFTQRYIAPFEGKVTAQAQQTDVDPAWVYGLIRQESRFIMDAKSVVGASGLMQLMPATARWVAKKIGMTDFSPTSVTDFDTNTRLGTSYLSMVLSDLGGSQVLASAGYNAGPGRPMQWRSKLSHPVEGAIFAETIPFNETRDYVKNVMSNATYYAALFSGVPQSLKQRLGQIIPQSYGRTELP